MHDYTWAFDVPKCRQNVVIYRNSKISISSLHYKPSKIVLKKEPNASHLYNYREGIVYN